MALTRQFPRFTYHGPQVTDLFVLLIVHRRPL
jgi:hypothetical protein